MAATINDKDKILQASPIRLGYSPNNYIYFSNAAPVFNVSSEGVNQPASYAITAQFAGGQLAGTVIWSVVSGTVASTGQSGNTWLINYADLTTDTAVIKATLNFLGVEYSAQLTVSKVSSALSAITALLSNETFVFTASNTGAVSSYANSGTEIRVFQGITELQYDGTGTAAGTWTLSTSEVNITRGTITDSGNYVTIGQHSAVDNNTDNSSIVYTITGKTTQNTSFTVTKTQTFSKSKAGSAGPSGPKNSQAYLYQWSPTTPGNPAGTSTYTWSTLDNAAYNGGNGWTTTVPANPGTPNIYLWVAVKSITAAGDATSSVLDWTTGVTVYSSAGNGAPGTNAINSAKVNLYQWAVTIPSSPTGTSTYTWATGSYTPIPSGWSAGIPTAPTSGFTLWEASVTLTEAATVTTSTINWTTASVLSVGYAGLNGTSPVVYSIETSAPVLTKQAPDAATAGTYSSVTIQGRKYDGNVSSNFGWVTVTANGATEATTATNTASTPVSLAPTTTAGTTSYTIKLYNQATVSGATLLDTQVLQVVFRGASGASGNSVYVATVYRQSATAPTAPIATASSYNFATNTLTPPTDWSVAQPATTTTPTYACDFTFSGAAGTTVTGTGSWSTPYIEAVAGSNGNNGEFRDVIQLFLTSASLPVAPTSIPYTFSSNTIGTQTGGTAGWSLTRPAATTTPTYVITALAATTTPAVAVTLTTWSAPVIAAQNGTNGNSVYVATVYQQSATALTAPVATASTYNFATNTLTPPSGWSVAQPATTTTPTYACDFTFSGAAGTTVTGTGSWSTPYIEAVAGSNGNNGEFRDVIQLFLTSASLPVAPTSIPYTFSSNTIGTQTGGTAGWSLTRPAATTTPTYVITALAATTTPAVAVTLTTWSAPVITAQNGTNGLNGLNGTRTAILDLYQWSSTVPTVFPSGDSTYTWSTAQFTNPATLNGWTSTPGTAVAGQILYVARQVYADSLTTNTSTVTWGVTTATPLGKAGDNGTIGSNGLRTAFLEMYLWSVSRPTSFPSGTSTYTWTTGEFTAPATTNNWSLTPGVALPGQTLWGVSVAVSDTLTSLTSQITWQYPKISQIAETGVTVGTGTRTAVLEMYRWSATQPTTFPSGSSTYTWSTQQFTAPAITNSWTLTPGSAVAGQRLWITRIVYTDSDTAGATAITWNTAVPYASAVNIAEIGVNTSVGTRTAVLEMYRWSATQPTTFPSGSSTYTWSTQQFTAPAITNSWTLTPGSAVAGQRLWVTRVVYTDSDTAGATAITWNYATAYATTTNIAEVGVSVSAGTRTAVLEMYRWSATQPTIFPSGFSNYTWNTQQFTAPGTPNGWSLVPPPAALNQRLWVTRAVYTDNDTANITAIAWNATQAISTEITNFNGQRVALLEMYQWALSQPSILPMGGSTYTWATGAFTPPNVPNGWSLSPGSAAFAGQKLWTTSVVYIDSLSTATTTINWGQPIIESTGVLGVSGQRAAILELYQWAYNQPSLLPSGNSTYTWATGVFTAPTTLNGWSLSPGSASFAGQKLWTASAAYIDNLSTSTTTIKLAEQQLVAETEILGVSGQRAAILEVFQWATSTPTTLPTGTSTYTWADGSFTAPTTPNGWSRAPGGAATAGQKLWAVAVPYTDTLSTATTSITWNYGIAYPVGAAGSSSLVVDLTNASHIFPASVTGAVSSYVNSGTEIRVYEGDTELLYNGVGTSNGTWTVSSSVGNNISPGSITDSGSFATVGQHGGVANETDTSIITYTVTGKTNSGTNFTLTKAQTFTKARVGATGTGTQGNSVRVMYARIANNPVPVAGTVSVTGDNRPTGTQGSAVWGTLFNVTWSASDPTPSSNDSLYQAEGIFNGTNTVWSAPYISSLKVGALNAITVNTGALTVSDTLTMGTLGSIRGGQTAYNTGTGFFIGYSTDNYKLSIGRPSVTATPSAAADTLTVTAHGYTKGDAFYVLNNNGNSDFVSNYVYYVQQVVSVNAFKVGTFSTSSSPINLLSNTAITIASRSLNWTGSKLETYGSNETYGDVSVLGNLSTFRQRAKLGPERLAFYRESGGANLFAGTDTYTATYGAGGFYISTDAGLAAPTCSIYDSNLLPSLYVSKSIATDYEVIGAISLNGTGLALEARGKINATSTIRSTGIDLNGSTIFTTGKGLELAYQPALNTGYLQSYNRDTSSYTKLYVSGTTVTINGADVGGGAGLLGIGTEQFGNNAFNTIAISRGAAPTSSPANVGQIFINPSTGHLMFRHDNGTVYQLTF
jgi:hypothetical protein